jgi:predicted dienelactone hydrolase
LAAGGFDASDPLRPGRYQVATLEMTLRDEARNRQVPVKVYFPKAGRGFPVLLFSHDIGRTRRDYGFLGRGWASHGLVCIHIQHPGGREAGFEEAAAFEAEPGSPPAAELLQQRATDVSFVLDELSRLNEAAGPVSGKMDPLRAAAAGHGYGAATALALAGMTLTGPDGRPVSAADPRIRAGLYMSPLPPLSALRQPEKAMADAFIPGLTMTGDQAPRANRRLPFAHAAGGDQFLLTLIDAEHFTFAGLAYENTMTRDRFFHGLIAAASSAFFEAYLKNDQAARRFLTRGGLARTLGGYGRFEVRVDR